MWSYKNSVRIKFGAGSLDEIGDLVQGRTYCLVTYDEPIFHGFAQRTAALAGPATLTMDNVVPNPDFHMLTASSDRFAAAETVPEVIVALGGDRLSTPPRWSPQAAMVSAPSNGFSKTARARTR